MMDEHKEAADGAAMAEGATVLRTEVSEVDADPAVEPAQACHLAVYFAPGSLSATAQYPLSGDAVAHLSAAAKVFDNLAGDYHAQGYTAEPWWPDGKGGKVRVGNKDLEIGPEDVCLCYMLDPQLRPMYDVSIGKAPKPVHLWAAAQLLRALANYTVSKAIAGVEMQQAMADQAREQLMSGRLPQDVRSRIRG